MPDQGPTREEIGRAEEAWYNTRKGTAYGGNLTEAARNALIAAEPLTRARHVREAVEGVKGNPEAISLIGVNGRHYMILRESVLAALLDALTKEPPHA